VYELSRIFRNEGISTQHNPEFTMLEFYQAYSDFRDLMDLTEEMITRIAESVSGSRQVTFQEHVLDFNHWQRYSMKEAILHFWPASVPKPAEADLGADEKLRALAREIGAEYAPSDGAGKVLAAVFDHVVEPNLIQRRLFTTTQRKSHPFPKPGPMTRALSSVLSCT